MLDIETKLLSRNFSQWFCFSIGNTWNLNFNFKSQVFPRNQDRKTNFFVCFWEKLRLDNFCFEIYWLQWNLITIESFFQIGFSGELTISLLCHGLQKRSKFTCWWWWYQSISFKIQAFWYMICLLAVQNKKVTNLLLVAVHNEANWQSVCAMYHQVVVCH